MFRLKKVYIVPWVAGLLMTPPVLKQIKMFDGCFVLQVMQHILHKVHVFSYKWNHEITPNDLVGGP